MRRGPREMPPEFPAVAALPLRELSAIFRASTNTLAKWRQELGVSVRVGAPKCNRNATHNPSRRKEGYGVDGPEQIHACLSCPAERCTGSCARLYGGPTTTL